MWLMDVCTRNETETRVYTASLKSNKLVTYLMEKCLEHSPFSVHASPFPYPFLSIFALGPEQAHSPSAQSLH